MPNRSPIRLAVAVSAAALLLAGCAATPADDSSDGGSAPAGGVELTNCGRDLAFDAAPERVVTIKSTATEMLLALGLGDRIVGTAFQDGPVPDEWTDAAAGLEVLSEKVPSEEVVLDLEPDLVYAGWESNLSADGAGERDELESLGVGTYVSPAACRSADAPVELSFEDVFREIEEVASIFRVDADDLVAEQRAALAGVEPVEGAPTALWYSSGSDTPYVGGGAGAPDLVMSTAGLENIAGDVDEAWASYNWEAVIEADPDVLVLVDAEWNDVENKISVLESNPATAELTAVREGRYVTVPFPASEAGVRSVDAAASIAEQLRELGF